MNRSSAKVSKYIGIAKDHIRKIFGCGLYAVNNSTLYETSSNDSNFFEPKSSSKVLLVDLSALNSNTIRKVVKTKHKTDKPTLLSKNIISSKAVNYQGEIEVKQLHQHQKRLTEREIAEIIVKYNSGTSTYDLAKEYGCHRRTISDHLKKQGIKVTNQLMERKGVVELVMQMYSEYIKPADIAKAIGINVDSVRKILKENNVYIRKSWEYPRM